MLLVALAVLASGCATPAPKPANTSQNNTLPGGNTSTGAFDLLPKADPAVLEELVLAQVHDEDGEPRYRHPGSPGHAATVAVLRAMLEARGLEVVEETFTAEVGRLGEQELTNLYGVRHGTSDREVWLAAHWDSRAWADGDPDPANHDEPCLGANDGAAAVAAVVHALDLLPPTNFTVRVALFDGEDQGDAGGWAVGSRHAAWAMTDEEIDAIVALLLVDMPGDKDLELRREGGSARANPWLVDLVFDTAAQLGVDAFQNTLGPTITDDHVAFLERGVPSIDLIHLDRDARRGPFPWTHHTIHDTPENLSYENIAAVTDVVVASVVRLDAGLGPADEL